MYVDKIKEVYCAINFGFTIVSLKLSKGFIHFFFTTIAVLFLFFVSLALCIGSMFNRIRFIEPAIAGMESVFVAENNQLSRSEFLVNSL